MLLNARNMKGSMFAFFPANVWVSWKEMDPEARLILEIQAYLALFIIAGFLVTIIVNWRSLSGVKAWHLILLFLTQNLILAGATIVGSSIFAVLLDGHAEDLAPIPFFASWILAIAISGKLLSYLRNGKSQE